MLSLAVGHIGSNGGGSSGSSTNGGSSICGSTGSAGHFSDIVFFDGTEARIIWINTAWALVVAILGITSFDWEMKRTDMIGRAAIVALLGFLVVNPTKLRIPDAIVVGGGSADGVQPPDALAILGFLGLVETLLGSTTVTPTSGLGTGIRVGLSLIHI